MNSPGLLPRCVELSRPSSRLARRWILQSVVGATAPLSSSSSSFSGCPSSARTGSRQLHGYRHRGGAAPSARLLLNNTRLAGSVSVLAAAAAGGGAPHMSGIGLGLGLAARGRGVRTIFIQTETTPNPDVS
jgi:hypothetical protein